ncbi:hypothetical protein [Streptomyces fuscigenes]|uniref:hypothetical protein n=1 Tax=Streptomyces fuscigenes TaxID=1528880 RepID=UPI001F2E2BB5|nr:hypothetical protein [Streptomyces fuscigenes]MCF3960607.1 hypothetical protein [Streptomyces fuscigenes]
MLNAAEASIDASAEDDGERTRNRAKLYAPPAGAVRRGTQRAGVTRPATGASRPSAPPGQGGMSRSHAQALMAQLAAEDARLAGPRNG